MSAATCWRLYQRFVVETVYQVWHGDIVLHTFEFYGQKVHAINVKQHMYYVVCDFQTASRS